MWKTGLVTADANLLVLGKSEWRPLMPIMGVIEASRKPPLVTLVKTAKSRGVFIIPGIFFGMLGIHNFYAGYHKRGTAELCVSVFLCWTFVAPAVVAFIALLEIITVVRMRTEIFFREACNATGRALPLSQRGDPIPDPGASLLGNTA